MLKKIAALLLVPVLLAGCSAAGDVETLLRAPQLSGDQRLPSSRAVRAPRSRPAKSGAAQASHLRCSTGMYMLSLTSRMRSLACLSARSSSFTGITVTENL